MILAGIYTRKSQADEKSDSMQAQVDMCVNYLDSHYGEGNYDVTIYDADYGISGHTTEKRKDFQRMMNDIKLGKIKLVLIQRYDRIARNTRDFVNLYYEMEKAGCDLVSVSQQIDTTTPYGKQFMFMQASMAELEWSLNSERRKDINQYAIKQGKFTSPDKNAPFGYKAERIDGIRRLVIDESKREIVMDIFAHYNLYHNKISCTRYINDKYGLTLSSSIIPRMIKNTLYKGEYHGNSEFCEPYVSPLAWEKMQIKKTLIRENDGIKKDALFSGLIHCPVCGRCMHGLNYSKKKGDNKSYYCRNHTYKTCDFKKSRSEKIIERQVLSLIESEFEKFENSIVMTKENKKSKDNAKKYKSELERLNIMYQKGRIDDNYYDVEYARLTRLIAQNEPKLGDITQLENTRNALSGEWKEVYLSLDRLSKKLFWREILDEIVVDMDMNVTDLIFRRVTP